MELSHKLTIIILFFVLLLIPHIGRAYVKSHPLREITPINTSLNMSKNAGGLSYNITNIKVINPSDNLKVGSKLIVGGNLDIRSSNIENLSEIGGFFSSACGNGSVVDRIYPNGSYSCVSVDREITDIWVNESGDIMGGQLNMNGSKIIQVGEPDNPQDAATKSYVDTASSNVNKSATQNLEEVLSEGSYAGNYSINMQEKNITSISYLNPSSGLNIGSSLNIEGNTNLNSFDLYSIRYVNASEFYDDGQPLTSKYLDISGDSMEGTLYFGNNPFTITNSSKITNLNADLLDSKNSSFYLNASNINTGIIDNQHIDIVQSEIPSLDPSWSGNVDSAVLENLSSLNYGILLSEENITDLQNYILQSDEKNLNVNSSEYWDNLNNTSDITGLKDYQIVEDLTANLTKGVGLVYTGQIANGSITDVKISGVLSDSVIEDDLTANLTKGLGKVYDSQITNVSDSKITGTGVLVTNLNADLLDGRHLANINWTDVALKQTDININDLGKADSNLYMNNYNITNISNLLNYFDSTCPSGYALSNIKENGDFQCVSIAGETSNLYVNKSGDVMSGNLGLGGFNINNVKLVDGINLENPGTGLNLTGNQYVAVLGDSISTSELQDGSVTNPKIALTAVNSSQVSFNYSSSPTKGGAASNALQLNDQPSSYYINETTNFTGDLSGTYDNLQLGVGVVGSNEISQGSVGNSEIMNSASFTLAHLTVTGDAEIQGNLDIWGNITNTQVNHLSVNGSLLPPKNYNNTFNIGNSTQQWKDLYIANDINVGGNVDGIDLDNPGDGLIVSGGQYHVNNGTGIVITSGKVRHEDTSNQNIVSNGGAIVIQNVTLDDFGHISNVQVKDLDVRYYTKSESNSNFVNRSGDTMNGQLNMSADIDMNGHSIKSSSEICIGDQCK